MRRHEIFVVDKLSYDICDDMHTHMRHKTSQQSKVRVIEVKSKENKSKVERASACWIN